MFSLQRSDVDPSSFFCEAAEADCARACVCGHNNIHHHHHSHLHTRGCTRTRQCEVLVRVEKECLCSGMTSGGGAAAVWGSQVENFY